MRLAKRLLPGLLVLGVVLDLAGGLLVDALKLPLFLDTVGTMFVAVIAGPWWGALTGLLSNLVLSMWIPGDLAFASVNIAIALTVGYIVRVRGFKDYLTPLLAGLAAGLVASVSQLDGPRIVFGVCQTAVAVGALAWYLYGRKNIVTYYQSLHSCSDDPEREEAEGMGEPGTP